MGRHTRATGEVGEPHLRGGELGERSHHSKSSRETKQLCSHSPHPEHLADVVPHDGLAAAGEDDLAGGLHLGLRFRRRRSGGVSGTAPGTDLVPDELPVPCFCDRPLNESLAQPPFVRMEQDAPELGQRFRADIVERP